jgi:hypothetical protein
MRCAVRCAGQNQNFRWTRRGKQGQFIVKKTSIFGNLGGFLAMIVNSTTSADRIFGFWRGKNA